jgi:hypothetical protein
VLFEECVTDKCLDDQAMLIAGVCRSTIIVNRPNRGTKIGVPKIAKSDSQKRVRSNGLMVWMRDEDEKTMKSREHERFS